MVVAVRLLLPRWTKLTMLAQSLISLITMVLVIAPAVNILKYGHHTVFLDEICTVCFSNYRTVSANSGAGCPWLERES
jgi:hypothetical protein